MESVEKFKELYEVLGKAIIDFETAMFANLSKYSEQEKDWIRNARIQKFEFCTELSWKTAKLYLESLEEKIYTPKLTIKSLFLQQLIDENTYLLLMNCISDRNLLSHIYKFEMFDQIHDELDVHLIALRQLYKVLGNVSLGDDF